MVCDLLVPIFNHLLNFQTQDVSIATFMRILITIGRIFYLIPYIIILISICWLSENVAKQVKCLKNKVMEEASNNTVDSNYICSLLDEFQGFDGNGFFTLNHSLLTGMAGSFFTFIVILNQFKQSETQQ